MTHRLDLADQTITYDMATPAGPTSSLPLVLLHGGVVDRRMWGPQLGAYPDRTVIAPDARGHGDSSDTEEPYRLTDDVIALLDALEIDRAVLVGISMGGGTAVDTALEHPGRVAGLVVSGTGTSEPEFTDPWMLATQADWKAAEVGGDLDGWLEVFMRFTAGPHRRAEDVDRGVRQLVETMARETIANHLRVGADGLPIPPTPPVPVTETWQRAGSIQVPVLALSGALDGDDHRALGRRLAETVPVGRHREVSGSGHYPNLENPAEFDRAVRDHLELHDL